MIHLGNKRWRGFYSTMTFWDIVRGETPKLDPMTDHYKTNALILVTFALEDNILTHIRDNWSKLSLYEAPNELQVYY